MLKERIYVAKGERKFEFKNCTVSLEDNEIVEYGKDSIDTFVLSDILREIESPNEHIDLKITFNKTLTPSESEGSKE